MQENTIMIPVQISQESASYYENMLLSLANSVVERTKEGLNQKQYMNKKEASQYIGVSFNTFQKMVKLGLPIIEIDGIKLVSKQDIDNFLEEHKNK